MSDWWKKISLWLGLVFIILASTNVLIRLDKALESGRAFSPAVRRIDFILLGIGVILLLNYFLGLLVKLLRKGRE